VVIYKHSVTAGIGYTPDLVVLSLGNHMQVHPTTSSFVPHSSFLLTNLQLIMIDYLLGRPSPSWKRTQVATIME